MDDILSMDIAFEQQPALDPKLLEEKVNFLEKKILLVFCINEKRKRFSLRFEKQALKCYLKLFYKPLFMKNDWKINLQQMIKNNGIQETRFILESELKFIKQYLNKIKMYDVAEKSINDILNIYWFSKEYFDFIERAHLFLEQLDGELNNFGGSVIHEITH